MGNPLSNPTSDVESNTSRNNTPVTAAPQEDQLDAKHILLFHSVMMLCGFYMAMVLTNWADTPAEGDDPVAMTSKSSMWVKLATQYLTMVLYTISLVAPVCCPSRFQDDN